MRFKDAICVITGAGSGIGEYTAYRLAEEGAKLILVGRTKSKLERVANHINEKHTSIIAEIFGCDVTNEDEVKKLGEYVQKKYGTIDILVNNAGVSSKSNIMELSGEQWDQVFDTNLKGVFLVSKELGKVMVKGSNQGNRSIVNVASLSAHKAGAKIPHYSAAKAGVISFTKALASELAPHGIRVNSVSPGFVETPLTEAGLKNPRFEEAIKRNTALGRVGRPEEIANIIAFISSEEASYMTGTDVLVDGGWLLM